MNWLKNYVAIDVETTGFGPLARVVELAAVTFLDGVPVNRWSTLLNVPDVDWSSSKVKEAMAVNGIAVADLADKPVFGQVFPQMLVELSVPVWVAHNAEFDVTQIRQEMRRLGKELLSPELVICTKHLGAFVDPEAPKNRLQDVVARYGVVQETTHRAEADAEACGLVLAAMARSGKLPDSDLDMKRLTQRAADSWSSRSSRRY